MFGKTCPRSLWNSEDASFRKTFIPNINLFMYNRSVNMSEWERLSHFNNPFGFMEYDYIGTFVCGKAGQTLTLANTQIAEHFPFIVQRSVNDHSFVLSFIQM